ncbi:MAG: hypothetical protein IPG47_08815 [Thermoflexaceae bacterium]|nr:hypothetical protein [Thermoflexaceae bacterium]
MLVEARRGRPPLTVTAAGERAIAVHIETNAGSRRLVVNFGDEVSVPAEGRVESVLCTDEGRFGGFGRAPRAEGGAIVMPPHAAAFFESVR